MENGDVMENGAEMTQVTVCYQTVMAIKSTPWWNRVQGCSKCDDVNVGWMWWNVRIWECEVKWRSWLPQLLACPWKGFLPTEECQQCHCGDQTYTLTCGMWNNNCVGTRQHRMLTCTWVHTMWVDDVSWQAFHRERFPSQWDTDHVRRNHNNKHGQHKSDEWRKVFVNTCIPKNTSIHKHCGWVKLDKI
jgi:hypothetical protein